MTERCSWCGTDPLYMAYHDTEWGVPQHDSRTLFEMLILEGFQAGLSWITILRKRENFRAAFAGFDPAILATWGETEVERLRADPSIIRHRGKIEATLAGARAWLRIEAREGFAPFLWRFAEGVAPPPPEPGRSARRNGAIARHVQGAEGRGFRFCGPTICYAFMQATGMVNDHLATCDFRDGPR
ncbi:DNA-3-methyladenine glycosylase I [Gemmobacter lanyuensis]